MGLVFLFQAWPSSWELYPSCGHVRGPGALGLSEGSALLLPGSETACVWNAAAGQLLCPWWALAWASPPSLQWESGCMPSWLFPHHFELSPGPSHRPVPLAHLVLYLEPESLNLPRPRSDLGSSCLSLLPHHNWYARAFLKPKVTRKPMYSDQVGVVE